LLIKPDLNETGKNIAKKLSRPSIRSHLPKENPMLEKIRKEKERHMQTGRYEK
jgi:hypothetical protein